jgi:hypothetical protein
MTALFDISIIGIIEFDKSKLLVVTFIVLVD